LFREWSEADFPKPSEFREIRSAPFPKQRIADGINFLGYIVRRRVIGSLHEKLQQAEQTLYRGGMASFENGRTVYPYPWQLLTQIRQWLNAYLSHFGKASTHRLIHALRQRFNWLDEYFYWCEVPILRKEKHLIEIGGNLVKKTILRKKGTRINKVVYRCPTPRHATRFAQQSVWFMGHLPGHVLMIQLGGFWQISFTPFCSYRFPHRDLAKLKPLLWESGFSVAWIEETGRQLSRITERALTYRWD